MAYEVGAFGGFSGGSAPLGNDSTVHVFWLSGMSCDGCSVSMLGASNPSIEDLVLDRVPELPLVVMHHPMISDESGHELMAQYAAAADGSLGAPYAPLFVGSAENHPAMSGFRAPDALSSTAYATPDGGTRKPISVMAVLKAS